MFTDFALDMFKNEIRLRLIDLEWTCKYALNYVFFIVSNENMARFLRMQNKIFYFCKFLNYYQICFIISNYRCMLHYPLFSYIFNCLELRESSGILCLSYQSEEMKFVRIQFILLLIFVMTIHFELINNLLI